MSVHDTASLKEERDEGANAVQQNAGEIGLETALQHSCLYKMLSQLSTCVRGVARIASEHSTNHSLRVDLAIEPSLVPFSQSVGSARRGAPLAAQCSWALFAAASADGRSAGALFCDIRSAYYNVIRQMVVGSTDSDAALLAGSWGRHSFIDI